MTKEYYTDYEDDTVFFYWKETIEENFTNNPLEFFDYIEEYCYSKKYNNPYWLQTLKDCDFGKNQKQFWWFKKSTRLQKRLGSIFTLFIDNEEMLDKRIEKLFTYEHNTEEFISWYLNNQLCPDWAYEILED